MTGHHFIVCIPTDEYCSNNNCTTDSATSCSSSSSSSSDLEESTSDELEEKPQLEKQSKAANDDEDGLSPSEVEPLISVSPDSTDVFVAIKDKDNSVANLVTKSKSAPALRKPASGNDLQEKEKDENGKEKDDSGKEKEEAITPEEEKEEEKRISKLTPEEIEQLEDVPEETEIYSLSERLEHILRDAGIDNDVWQKSRNRQQQQITFTSPKYLADTLLKRMKQIGIGSTPNTSVQMLEPTVGYLGNDWEKAMEKTENKSDAGKSGAFMKAVKQRLTVHQILERIRPSAQLTRTYCFIIFAASMLAAIGLSSNNNSYIVGSMLVSPLMGPLLGMVLGLATHDIQLLTRGLKTFTIGLVLCFAVGLVCGMIMSLANMHGLPYPEATSYPTREMSARGLPSSIGFGSVGAFFSGISAGMAMTDGDVPTSVGAAIAASLLPPAVNSGMLLAHSIISAFHPPMLLRDALGGATTAAPNSTEPSYTETTQPAGYDDSSATHWTSKFYHTCPRLLHNDYQFIFSCNMPKEAAAMAAMSFLVVMINVIAVVLVVWAIAKMRNVLPTSTLPEGKVMFWNKDIKMHAGQNKTVKKTVESDSIRRIAADIAKKMVPQNEENPYKVHNEFKEFIKAIENDESHLNTVHNPAMAIKILREVEEMGAEEIHERFGEEAYKQHYNTIHACDMMSNLHNTARRPTSMYGMASPTSYPLSAPVSDVPFFKRLVSQQEENDDMTTKPIPVYKPAKPHHHRRHRRHSKKPKKPKVTVTQAGRFKVRTMEHDDEKKDDQDESGTPSASGTPVASPSATPSPAPQCDGPAAPLPTIPSVGNVREKNEELQPDDSPRTRSRNRSVSPSVRFMLPDKE